MDKSVIERCIDDFAHAGFQCEEEFLRRFVASLAAKRFVILTGLSGSGKTRLAQSFAKWISPTQVRPDAFERGVRIGNSYRVMDSDRIAVEFWNPDNEKVVLPRRLIDEWADFIELNPSLASLPSQEIRSKFKEQCDTKFAKHAILWDTHLKPAALAVLESRKDSQKSFRCHEVVAVGADWTSNEQVLGYSDGLDRKRYVRTKALDLILNAAASPDVPHFLILDEMNLSHVERYFADLLSAIESGEPMHLHAGEGEGGDNEIRSGVPPRLKLPENLFIIGTVNVDETTYMFSPKVLDRANVLEFRVTENALQNFLGAPASIDDSLIEAKGAAHASSFLKLARSEHGLTPDELASVNREILLFFKALQPAGIEFGFRVAKEIVSFVGQHKRLAGDAWSLRTALDAQVVQKLLPKLHGARHKLEPILWSFAILCHSQRLESGDAEEVSKDFQAILARALSAFEMNDNVYDPLGTRGNGERVLLPSGAHFPLSFDKVVRMLASVRMNGFTSFAEG